jgi:hypothetical protein
LAASLESDASAAGLIEQMQPHVGYALQRLRDVAQPAVFGPIEKLPNAFREGSAEFDRMVAEAAANVVSILWAQAERRQRG